MWRQVLLPFVAGDAAAAGAAAAKAAAAADATAPRVFAKRRLWQHSVAPCVEGETGIDMLRCTRPESVSYSAVVTAPRRRPARARLGEARQTHLMRLVMAPGVRLLAILASRARSPLPPSAARAPRALRAAGAPCALRAARAPPPR